MVILHHPMKSRYDTFKNKSRFERHVVEFGLNFILKDGRATCVQLRDKFDPITSYYNIDA